MKNIIYGIFVMSVIGCGNGEYEKVTTHNHHKNKTTEGGPQGPEGKAGTDGATGAQGAKGPKGDKGDTGAVGATGPQGVQGPQGVPGTAGASGTVVVVQTAPSAGTISADQQIVNNLVNQTNVNRQLVGQEPIAPGLSCSVYKFGTPSVPQSPNSITQATSGAPWALYNTLNFSTAGTFNQPNVNTNLGFNVFPSYIETDPSFQTQYYLRCTGYLVVTTSNYYTWSLTSDDGSILSINGLTVNNDGAHSVQTVTGSQILNQGIYSIQLQYIQFNGNQDLTLTWNANLINPNYLWH